MKASKHRLIVYVFLVVLLSTCATQPSLRERLEELPVKHLDFYNFDSSTPIVDRVVDIPDELLDLYSQGEDEELHRYHPSDAEKMEIAAWYKKLPVLHREVLQERLVGIYCVENFAGSGMADWILGPDDSLYVVLILHPRVFDLSASELLTYRENTAFREEDPEIEFSIELSEEVSGLAYILLHESTHMVDYVQRHTPFVAPNMETLFGTSPADTSFTDSVWRGYRSIRRSAVLSFQQDLRFYGLGGEPGLSNRSLVSVCEEIAQSPFASLYASTSWAEDFAEFVTFYYLVNSLGVRYAMTITQDGESVFSYEPMKSQTVLVRAHLLDSRLLEMM